MRRYKILLIIFIAFAVRFIALLLLGRHISPEVWEYDETALNLLQNKGYVTNNLNTPYYSLTYPVFVALTAISHFLTNRNYFILEIFQIILAAITCYFIYLLGKRIFNKEVGLLSSFLVAMHPGLIVYSTKLHELTLVAFMIILTFWLILILDWKKNFNNILIGCLIGLGSLTRPSLMLFLPIYFVYILLSSKSIKTTLRALLIVSLSTIILILPWTIRNYKIHKRLILISTNSAELFWRGNNPAASGSALTKDGRSIVESAPKEFVDRLYKMNEIEQYDFLYKEAFSFIKANPILFLINTCKKLFYFWWFSPQTGLLYPPLWTVVYQGYYSILFIFFIFGLYISLTKLPYSLRVPYILLAIFFIVISLFQALHYVELRHRWAIEPLMIIFSCYGFFIITERIKNNNWKYRS